MNHRALAAGEIRPPSPAPSSPLERTAGSCAPYDGYRSRGPEQEGLSCPLCGSAIEPDPWDEGVTYRCGSGCCRLTREQYQELLVDRRLFLYLVTQLPTDQEAFNRAYDDCPLYSGGNIEAPPL